MGQIKWYKRDPEKALSGMLGLSLEERGAYNTVLDLIYVRDGKLPDDDYFIAGNMSVDVRVWRRLKKKLISLGKIKIIDGIIRDDMADVVLTDALAKVTQAREAGKQSAASRANKSGSQNHKNKDLGSTPVEAGVPTDDPTIKNKNKIEPNGSIPPTPQHTTMSDWPEIPEWIPVDEWNGFIAMRKRKGGMPTARAIQLMLGKLEKWRSKGQDPGAVLDQSTEAQWTGIFEIKDDRNGKGNRDNRDGFARELDERLGVGTAG